MNKSLKLKCRSGEIIDEMRAYHEGIRPCNQEYLSEALHIYNKRSVYLVRKKIRAWAQIDIQTNTPTRCNLTLALMTKSFLTPHVTTDISKRACPNSLVRAPILHNARLLFRSKLQLMLQSIDMLPLLSLICCGDSR